MAIGHTPTQEEALEYVVNYLRKLADQIEADRSHIAGMHWEKFVDEEFMGGIEITPHIFPSNRRKMTLEWVWHKVPDVEFG
jgi:hypothetical protein